MAKIDLVFLVFMVLAVSLPATPIMGVTYTVGDSNGWALGVDYTAWASSKSFKVGDSLVFHYGSSHSVLEVGSSEYTSCSLSNPLSADRSGTTTITLNTPGEHYFVCGVPGHCEGGQKLEVAVSAAAPLESTPATAVPPSGNSVASERPSIAANAPASTASNDAPLHSSSAMALSPIVASIFFIGVIVSTLIV